jgi:hypothetical protein
MFGFLSPYCWQDANTNSGYLVNGPTTLETTTLPIINDPTAGTNVVPTGFNRSTFEPVRPYATGDGRTARLVSYGLRVRYSGTALNANGTLRLLATPHGEMDLLGGRTYASAISLLNGSHATQQKTIYDKAVFEFSFIGNDEWSGNGTGADQDMIQGLGRVGQASSPRFSSEPGCVLYYTNNSTAAVQFDYELIEHWEVRGQTIAPFYTDSHSDPALHHEIMNVVNTAHVRAGLNSESKFIGVVNSVAKASKSPLGKVVLAAALA